MTADDWAGVPRTAWQWRILGAAFLLFGGALIA